MRKIILDVDTGTDDALAIILALKNPKIEVLGITVTWGNQPVEVCVNNTLDVVDFLNSNVKVYQGEKHCLCPEKAKTLQEINPEGPIYYYDDKNLLHHLHPAKMALPDHHSKVQEQNAVDFIIDTLLNTKEKITLVPVGPPTNIAKAILKEPKIIEHLEEIVFMGGSVKMGNVTPTAEANFYNDADAVKVIFDSNVKCVLASLNATSSAPFSKQEIQEYKNINTKESIFAAYIIETRADVEAHLGWSDGQLEAVHDPLAVAYLINPEVFTKIERHQVAIDNSKSLKAGTLLLDHNQGNKNVYIGLEADINIYHNLIKKAISN